MGWLSGSLQSGPVASLINHSLVVGYGGVAFDGNGFGLSTLQDEDAC